MIKTLEVNIPQKMLDLARNYDGDGLRDFLGVNNYTNEFEVWLTNYFEKPKVMRNWINYTKHDPQIDNTFNWHDDIHRKGSILCILWIRGSVDCGGDLLVMDELANIERIKFKPNLLIIMENKFPHKVETYFGEDSRIALNFTLL